MENAEEVLQCLDEFSKLKPKDIPRELEEYLCFVAKTGDPVYQWPLIKCLFREKLINVITEFYETCPTVEIPPCPNVDAFNYDAMKNFILDKLDTFAAAPFTVQRICELLTSPRKEYNRIDKYMRALEKNILVVSTREPGNRKSTENGESIVNGLDSEHGTQDMVNSDVNVEVEMDETATWQKSEPVPYAVSEANIILEPQPTHSENIQDAYVSESKVNDTATCSSSGESVITSRPISYIGYTPNIADLIIEPSNVSNNSESGPTAMSVENSEPTIEPQNITVYAMSNEYSVPAEQTQTENIKESTSFDKAAVSVCAKQNCSETAFTSIVQLEPEPSLVQIEPASNSELKEPEPEPGREPIQEQEPAVAKLPKVIESPPETPEQSEPESSTQPEPESSSVVQLQPESSLVYLNAESEQAQPNSAAEESTNETTISSTEQLPANSTDVQATSHPPAESEVPEISGATSEETVTESNIQSEYMVSQTEQPEPVVPSEDASALPAEESHQEVAEERMQVDEVSTESTEQQTEAQTTETN